jgi:hypothetical protein
MLVDFSKYSDEMNELQEKDPNAQGSSKVSKDKEADLHC